MEKYGLSRIENFLTYTREKLLVAEILHGRPEKFAEIVSAYRKKVMNLGMSFFHDSDDAEDFSQDVFIKVFENLAGFRGKSRLSTWIMRIAWNMAINSKTRKKTDDAILEDDLIVSSDDTPEESAVKKSVRESIALAVENLDEKYRICLELYFYHGMKYDEISEVTGFPTGTIKTNVFRAKKILSEKLCDLRF